MLDQVISILEKLHVKVCDFTTKWAEAMETAFKGDAISTASDSFIKKIQRYPSYVIVTFMSIEDYVLRANFKYVDELLTQKKKFFGKVNEETCNKIAELIETSTNLLQEAEVDLIETIKELPDELGTLVGLSVKIRTTSEQIIPIKSDTKLGKVEKNQKLIAPIKQIEQYLNDKKAPNLMNLRAFTKKVLARLQSAHDCVGYLPEALKEYFAEEPNILFRNPFYVFNLAEVQLVRDGFRKQKTSVTEFKVKLEKKKSAKSDEMQWLTDLNKFLDDDSVALDKMNVVISEFKPEAITYVKNLIMSHPLSKEVDFTKCFQELEKFYANFEPYLAKISPLTYESLFNNKYDWGKELFQPNEETICALVDDQDLIKVIADTRDKIKVVNSKIESTANQITTEFSDLVETTYDIQTALAEIKYISEDSEVKHEIKVKRLHVVIEQLETIFRLGSGIFSGHLLKNNVTSKVRELENLVKTLHNDQVDFPKHLEKCFQNKRQPVKTANKPQPPSVTQPTTSASQKSNIKGKEKEGNGNSQHSIGTKPTGSSTRLSLANHPQNTATQSAEKTTPSSAKTPSNSLGTHPKSTSIDQPDAAAKKQSFEKVKSTLTYPNINGAVKAVHSSQLTAPAARPFSSAVQQSNIKENETTKKGNPQQSVGNKPTNSPRQSQGTNHLPNLAAQSTDKPAEAAKKRPKSSKRMRIKRFFGLPCGRVD